MKDIIIFLIKQIALRSDVLACLWILVFWSSCHELTPEVTCTSSEGTTSQYYGRCIIFKAVSYTHLDVYKRQQTYLVRPPIEWD